MIKSVTVTNHLGESLKMDLFDPEKSGILISSITGIGAPDSDINRTDYAIADGSYFSSARANYRTINMTVRPLWTDTQSVETSRQLTYRYFPMKHNIKLQFETDNHTLEIDGYVKKNEPTIFSKDETIILMIECMNPWFYLIGGANSVVFSGVQPCFEFPFCNNKTENGTETIEHVEYDEFGRVIRRWTEVVEIPDSKGLLKMGEIKKEKSQVVTYNGEIEVGFEITIEATADGVTNILIWKQETSEFIRIDTSKIASITGSAFAKGDMIVISTVSGDRRVQIIRGNGATNIIGAFDLNSSWIQLTSGANTFWYTADAGEDDMLFKMDYRTAYQGV